VGERGRAPTASGPSTASTRQATGRQDPFDDLITRHSGSPSSSEHLCRYAPSFAG